MTSDEEYTLAGQVASWFDSSSVAHRLVAIVSVAEALDAAMDCFRDTPSLRTNRQPRQCGSCG
jgi:hypothetical protein